MSDQKVPREPRPREKITLDTVIPPMPSKSDRLPPPDEDRHERDLKILDSKISKLKDKKKEINNQIKEKKEGGKMENQDLSVKQFIDEKFSTRKEKVALRNKLRDELDSLKQEFFSMIDEQKKLRPKIKIFDKIKTEKKIEEIQTRIESTTLTLQEEKKLISELSELQVSVPLITLHASRAKRIDENKARQEVIKAQISVISEEIDLTTSVIDETKNKIKSSKDARSSEIPALAEERKHLQEEIHGLESDKKKLMDEFREKKFAYNKQMNEIKQIEWMTKMKNRIIEQEERKKKQEEFEKIEEMNKPHPYANEIMSCDTYIAYLSKFIPKEVVEIQGEKEKVDFLPSKNEQMAKESEEWFGKGEKKAKKGKGKKAKKTEGFLSNQPIDLLNFFSYYGVKLPTSAEEAKQAISELQKRKAEWIAQDTRTEPKASKSTSAIKSGDLPLDPNVPI